MGFVARDWGVDSDHLVFGRSSHHGMNEVWSNEYAKWVLFDAKHHDIQYERDGVPLSVLEVHEAVRPTSEPLRAKNGNSSIFYFRTAAGRTGNRKPTTGNRLI